MFGLDNRQIVTLKYDSDTGTPKDWESQVLRALKTMNISAHYVNVYGSSASVLLHSEADVKRLIDSGLTIGGKAYSIKGKMCVQPRWPYAGAVVGLARYAEEFAQQLAGMVQAHYPGRYLGSMVEVGNNVLVFYVKDWETISEVTSNPSFFLEHLVSSEADISAPKLLYYFNEKGFYVPKSTAAAMNSMSTTHEANISKVFEQLAEHCMQVDVMVSSADCAIASLTQQMKQTMGIMNTMSTVVQTQGQAVASLNNTVRGMIQTVGGQMEISGL